MLISKVSPAFDVTKVERFLLDKNNDLNKGGVNKNESSNQKDVKSENIMNEKINQSLKDMPKNMSSTAANIISKSKSKKEIFGSYQEFVNPSGFINTSNGASIKMSDYIGKKIILIDFMTYSCINCQRTFPYLNDWYSKYESKGLVIIGIHTPEFAFEKKKENIEKALDEFGIKFPVVLDNDYGTWNAYRNSYWPRKYLIDLEGDIVYDHSGEGEYQETEDKIVELLNTLPENVIGLPNGNMISTFSPDFSKIGSHETYLGFNRLDYNAIDIDKSCLNKTCKFTSPEKDNFPKNTFSFEGDWMINSENAIGEKGSSIYYNFTASKVHLVMGSKAGAKVKVTLDGDENNGRIINVSYETLYDLVDLKGKYENHIMKMEIISGNLEAFAFTFS